MSYVTVLMPVHNAEQFLSEAIESVLAQTYADFEFLIVDDGSTDGSLQIIEKYASHDPRIRVLKQGNRGMGFALNRGLLLAQGELVVRMDADDIMLPNRIERQVYFMSENPDVVVASCLVYYINKQGKVIGRNRPYLSSREEFWQLLQGDELIGFHHPGVIMRRVPVLSVGGYRPRFWPADDLDLWLRLAEKGYICLVQPEYLLKYRIHSSSISVRGARLARVKVDWVRECMLARRRGRKEPSWHEFLAVRRGRSFVCQVNRERKDLAKVLYKLAVTCYANGMRARALWYGFIATLLQPGYVLSQVRSKHL